LPPVHCPAPPQSQPGPAASAGTPPDKDPLQDHSSPSHPGQKHSAHSPEVVTIHYSWHPLHGQVLPVHRRAKFPRGEYVFCQLPDGTLGGFPSWVADPSISPDFTLGPPMT